MGLTAKRSCGAADGFLLSLFALLSWSLPFSAPAAAQLIRGPYLQICTSTSIVVRWRTDLLIDSLVRYGTNMANLSASVTDPNLSTEHEVRLVGLRPETHYAYAIGSTAGDLAAAPDLFFVTAPRPGASRPTRVWFVSDYGYGDANEQAVRDSYLRVAQASRPADVWLTGGDNDQIWGADDTMQTTVFGVYGPMLRHLALWPTYGNHDESTWSVPGPHPYFDNFTMPTAGEGGGVASGSEAYYAFDHGDVHFVSLDSIDPTQSASPDTPMIRWLKADLAATSRTWKIAYWHAPPYSKGSHDSDGNEGGYSTQMREQVLPILESYGVDLVLCGHTHVYERSYLLYGHYGFSWTFSEANKVNGGNGQEDGDGAYQQVNGRGTVYVEAGVGGQLRGFCCGHHPANLVNIDWALGSCLVDINIDRLEFQFLDTQSQALDHFTLLKEPRPRILTLLKGWNLAALQWTSVPGRFYTVECAETLDGVRQTLAERIQSSGDVTAWLGPIDSAATTLFFFISSSR
jgi:acid phosphatase type 7